MTFDAAPTLPAWMTVAGGDQDLRTEFLINSSWTDLSSRAFDNTGTIQRGHPDESTTAAASVLASDFDNHDGVMSSLNPLSPYYGQLGLNTPARISIPDQAKHLRLENDSVSGVKTASQAAFMPTGDFEVWIDADLDNWYGTQILASKYAVTSNQRSWVLYTNGLGQLQFAVSIDGAFGNSHIFANVSTLLPKVHGRMSVRASFTSATGTCVFYYGQNCANWVSLGGGTFGTSVVAFHTSTAPVEVGFAADAGDLASGISGANGKIYAFALIPSVGGAAATAVTSWDNTSLSGTAFTDLQSNSWTAQGNPEISTRNYRGHFESSAWPQSWTPGDPNYRIRLAGAGLLRRIGVANQPINSAMYRAATRLTGLYAPLGYWPFEDLAGSTSIGSAIGGTPGVIGGGPANLGSSTVFASSAGMMTLNGKTSYTCRLPKYTNTTLAAPPTGGGGGDAVVRFLMNTPSGGDVNLGVIARIYYTGGTVSRADLIYGTGGSLTLTIFDGSNTQITTTTTGFAVNGVLNRVSVELVNNGSGGYTPAIVTVAAGASTGLSTGLGLQAGAVGAVASVIFSPDQLLNGTAIGHLTVQNTWQSLFALGSAVAAYVGEAAGIRFQRLCTEEGIPFRGMGILSATAALGTQGLSTLTSLLQECADADRGMWYETRQVLGWGYRTRESLGNKMPTLALDYTQEHLSGTIDPTDDDQVIKNDVQVQNTDGSIGRQILNDGSIKSIGKIGRYDTQVSVNLANDSQCNDEAGWILHELTATDPRFKLLSLDLANTSLPAALYWSALELDAGDRITVANPPVNLPPGLIDQIVLGSLDTLGRKAYQIDLNGRPTTPWNVAYADDLVYGRADTDGTTLSSSQTSSATSLPVTVAVKAMGWTTDPQEFPFDVGLGGERVTVNSISGHIISPGLESGIGNWTAAGNSTIAVSGAKFRSGANSLAITSAAAGDMFASDCLGGSILTQGLACSPGDTIYGSAWLLTAVTSRQVVAGIGYYTSGAVLINNIYQNLPVFDNTATWVQAWTAQVAPATSAFCRLVIRVVNPAAANEVHYADDAFLWNLTAGGSQTMAVTRSVNGVVKAQASGADIRLWTPYIPSLT